MPEPIDCETIGADGEVDGEVDDGGVAHADRWNHWHGFTQMAAYRSWVIERGEGNWLIDSQGGRYLDGVSSMWCNVHGHRKREIDEAIIAQVGRVAHVTSLGMGCDTTARLAGRLAEIAPGDLDHTFFSSDGSSAIETALKLAMQYWGHAAGREGVAGLAAKTKYLAVGSAYHGDTTGAVSLGDIPRFHHLFKPILFETLRGPCPDTYRLPQGVGSVEEALGNYAGCYEALIREHHHELAAVVIEPLIQAAAGMILHPPGFLARLRRACDEHRVLLIADEVATGFGRTGRMFAVEHEGVVPDLLCLGKGLTGGYLPMAATVARRFLFEAFFAPRDKGAQFFHGHTFGGNPLAAAAALASIELFGKERILEQLPAKGERIDAGLVRLADHPRVGSIRRIGLMVGIELVADRRMKRPFPAGWEVGQQVCELALGKGVWVRPLGDVIVLMPPLSVTAEEIDLLVAAVCDAIETVTATLARPSASGPRGAPAGGRVSSVSVF
jgi:adenosylmethionine-8-amino-7-oxononanoate aminotransferase